MLARTGESFTHIVALTTYPARIRLPEVPVVLFSIIRQKTKVPFRLVLVLATTEFPGGPDDLPEGIRRLAKAGLMEILWCPENLKAAKKYWPVHAKYPDKPIMTTDDDILLDTDCVERFVEESRKHPGCVLTEVGHLLCDRWPDVVTGTFRLYPPGSMLDLPWTYFRDCYGMLEDDAYNAALAALKGTRTVIVGSGKCHIVESGGFTSTAFAKKYLKVDPVGCREKLGKRISVKQ